MVRPKSPNFHLPKMILVNAVMLFCDAAKSSGQNRRLYRPAKAGYRTATTQGHYVLVLTAVDKRIFWPLVAGISPAIELVWRNRNVREATYHEVIFGL